MENIDNGMLPLALRDICDDEDCKKHIADACTKMLECGHACGGFRGEASCLPCLKEECVEKMHKGEGPPG